MSSNASGAPSPRRNNSYREVGRLIRERLEKKRRRDRVLDALRPGKAETRQLIARWLFIGLLVGALVIEALAAKAL